MKNKVVFKCSWVGKIFSTIGAANSFFSVFGIWRLTSYLEFVIYFMLAGGLGDTAVTNNIFQEAKLLFGTKQIKYVRIK